MVKLVARYFAMAVFALAFLGAFAFWVTGAVYFQFLLPHTPIKPDFAHGFIYPHNNHGVIHYFQYFDHVLDDATGTAAFICIPILVFYGLIYGVFINAYQEGKDRHLGE